MSDTLINSEVEVVSFWWSHIAPALQIKNKFFRMSPWVVMQKKKKKQGEKLNDRNTFYVEAHVVWNPVEYIVVYKTAFLRFNVPRIYQT